MAGARDDDAVCGEGVVDGDASIGDSDRMGESESRLDVDRAGDGMGLTMDDGDGAMAEVGVVGTVSVSANGFDVDAATGVVDAEDAAVVLRAIRRCSTLPRSCSIIWRTERISFEFALLLTGLLLVLALALFWLFALFPCVGECALDGAAEGAADVAADGGTLVCSNSGMIRFAALINSRRRMTSISASEGRM